MYFSYILIFRTLIRQHASCFDRAYLMEFVVVNNNMPKTPF